MKRDMELIRSILLGIEGEEAADLSDYSHEQINYHNWLLLDAGLALGSETGSYDANHPAAYLTFLNWQGHEFLDAARNDTIWNKAMETVKKNVGSTSFDILLALLIAYGKKKLEI